MNDWQKTTLGSVCKAGGGTIQTGPFGSQLHASDYVESGVPSVMPQNIGDNRIDDDGIARITEDDARRLEKYRLRANDIVYSRRGDVERRALVRPENDGWLCGTGCLKVSFGDNPVVDPAFVSYFLGTPTSRAWIVNHAVGATMPNLNTKILESVPLQLPAKDEQKRIADVLGALDDKIDANTKLAKTSDELAGALFDRVADPLPRQIMSSILDPILGGTPARSNGDFWDGGELWASAKDITGAQCFVVLDTEEKITTSAVEKTKAKPLPAGSVIITARGTVGAVARLGSPAAFNQSCYGFLPDRLPPSLLYFSVLRAAEHAKSLVHGSVFDTVTKRTFDHLLIPDFGDSADAIEARLSPLLELVTAKLEENNTLESIRDALLPPLMSGKLRVKDAEKVVEDAV